MFRSTRLVTFALGAALVAVAAAALLASQPASPPMRDGLIRSELSLGGRTATVIYAPDRKAGGPLTSRVQIARLETTGALRLGPLDIAGPATPNPTPAESRPPVATAPAVAVYELWLESTADGWQLHVTSAGKADVGQVVLAREAATPSAPNLVAALVPEDSTAGRLVIRWADYEAATDVQFMTPLRRRVDESRAPNVTINRTHDEDTSVLSRARLLAQRNETAFVLPKGQRVSVSFQRTFPRSDRADAAQTARGLGVDGPDFARLSQMRAGEVVMLTESSVPRLRTELPLRFGRISVGTGNQVPGFPGSYGLWLKKVAAGWRLLFNHEPDAWGSQHDPKFDAAEVPLTHSEGPAANRPFAVAIVPGAADRGRLVIIWGPHEWTVDFAIGG